MKYFRPSIISVLALAITIGFFTGKIEPSAFATFATGLIVYWFKSRDEAKKD